MADIFKTEIRVRLAPSPTGLFHFGTARTALFNWIFAKNQGGKFILRVEDTDFERSEKKYEEDIINGLKWLGLNWEEGPDIDGSYGPYRQSERLDIYEKYLKQLIEEKKAFHCFCSKEEIEADRQAMISQGLSPKYGGRCQNLSEEKVNERLRKGEKAVIRFKMPAVRLEFSDLIRDKISADMGLIGDIVIARNLKSPLFYFAGVVDDYAMKISHVIRGEDHISNTPKQIMLQRALGFPEPQYAHLPLILSPDRSKLSKRYIDASLNDFQSQGYLPEAMNNFMAFLGWHPKDDREIITMKEIIKEFDLKRIQKAGAVFNLEKLEWLNAQHIRKLSDNDLTERLKNFIPEKWRLEKELIGKIIKFEKERIKKLSDFKEIAEFFFELPNYDKDMLIWKTSNKEKTKIILENLYNEIKKMAESDYAGLKEIIMPIAEAWGRGEVLWPLRVALSGKETSPGPFEIIEILGKEKSLARVKIAINKIS
ncbi:MAG: glutamate--tRNA ligase [Patescibacteria group bacterium]|nr:glutamate--tRNA ligase [Patescibacteria group bacterium]